MVSLSITFAVIFGSLSVLCLCIFASAPRMRAVAWLGAAIAIASAVTFCIAYTPGTFLEPLIVTCSLPICFACLAEATRLATRRPYPNVRLRAAGAVLTIASLALMAAGAPFTIQTSPLQLACALLLMESAHHVWRATRRSILDYTLCGLNCFMVGIFLMRTFIFPVFYPLDATYMSAKASMLESVFLLSAGIVSPIGIFLILARIIGVVIAEYREQAERDDLTGLLGRAAFDRQCSEQAGSRGAVIFCDIDHFKQVNDLYGHHAGDEVIRALAAILADTGFLAGRLGGEEFALLLPGLDAQSAQGLAEALRQAFGELRHAGMDEGTRISASFGVASYDAGSALHKAFAAADKALYNAKHLGRDQVAIQPETQIAA